MIEIRCEYCNSAFLVYPSRLDSARYCSNECRNKARTSEAISRFWDRFDKSGDCWEWTGRRIGAGYGGVTVGGKSRYVHRVAYELSRGRRLLPKEQVLHHCDNPPCGKPDHLFSGTQADNMQDMAQKGREHKPGAVGMRNTNARLSESSVRSIRERYESGGVTLSALAREYRVSVQTIRSVILRETWKHVT